MTTCRFCNEAHGEGECASDTPRTNAAISQRRYYEQRGAWHGDDVFLYVEPEDARSIERELQAELAAQSRELHQHKKYLYDIYHWIDSTCPQGFADEAIRCIPEEARDFIFAEKASEGYTPRKPDVDSRQYQSSETRSKLVPPGDAQLMLYQSRELARLRAKVGMLQANSDRYEWLRSRLYGFDADFCESGLGVVFKFPEDSRIGCGGAIDAAIDAAIERSK